MIAVIQRVKRASCIINETEYSKIGAGLLVFLGIEDRDSQDDVSWLSNKVVNMRIFSDDDDKMNLSCKDINAGIMVISQFTLHASTKKGNRPSFIKAARPEQAIPLYESFIDEVTLLNGKVESGKFGADMEITLANDGPVTIIVDSQNRL